MSAEIPQLVIWCQSHYTFGPQPSVVSNWNSPQKFETDAVGVSYTRVWCCVQISVWSYKYRRGFPFPDRLWLWVTLDSRGGFHERESRSLILMPWAWVNFCKYLHFCLFVCFCHVHHGVMVLWSAEIQLYATTRAGVTSLDDYRGVTGAVMSSTQCELNGVSFGLIFRAVNSRLWRNFSWSFPVPQSFAMSDCHDI